MVSRWSFGEGIENGLWSSCSIQLEPDLYTVLLSYLPNLKAIHFDSLPQFQEGYARLLSSAANSQQCLQRIQKIDIRDLMHGIQNGGRFYHQLYFSTYYKLRQRLSHLAIKYPNVSNIDIKFTYYGIIGDYIHFLPDFTQLTDLAIYNTLKNSAKENKGIEVIEACVLPFFRVLNTCHSLVNFNYECFPRVPSDELLNEMESATINK